MASTTLTSTASVGAARWWAVAWRGLLKPARVLVLPGMAPQVHAGSGEGGVAAVAGAVAASAGAADLPVPAFDAALLAWRDWCRAHAGQRCKLALSTAWTLTGLAPLPADTSPGMTAEQAVDHMARQWGHYLGVSAAALGRDWVVRTTRVPGGWLVCATPRQLVQDLLAIAQSHRVRVVWMGPWWTRGLQRWVRQARALSVQIQEPGWCLHAETDPSPQARPALTNVWSEPVAHATSTPDASGDEHTLSLSHKDAMRVRLSRHGAASAACVWDDAATQDLIDGVLSVWSISISLGVKA